MIREAPFEFSKLESLFGPLAHPPVHSTDRGMSWEVGRSLRRSIRPYRISAMGRYIHSRRKKTDGARYSNRTLAFYFKVYPLLGVIPPLILAVRVKLAP